MTDPAPDAKAMYSVGTFDCEIYAYTPQDGVTKSFNMTWLELRTAIRELRQCGYTAHRTRDKDGSHDDNDTAVLIERTDGKSQEEIMEGWKR